MPKKTKKALKNEELVYLALGIADMGTEQMRKLLKELVKTKKLTEKNQDKMHKDLISRGKREYSLLLSAYKEAVKGANKTMKALTRKQSK